MERTKEALVLHLFVRFVLPLCLESQALRDEPNATKGAVYITSPTTTQSKKKLHEQIDHKLQRAQRSKCRQLCLRRKPQEKRSTVLNREPPSRLRFQNITRVLIYGRASCQLTWCDDQLWKAARRRTHEQEETDATKNCSSEVFVEFTDYYQQQKAKDVTKLHSTAISLLSHWLLDFFFLSKRGGALKCSQRQDLPGGFAMMQILNG